MEVEGAVFEFAMTLDVDGIPSVTEAELVIVVVDSLLPSGEVEFRFSVERVDFAE